MGFLKTWMSSYLWSWVDAISPSPFNIHPPAPSASLIFRGLKMISLGVMLACLLLLVSAFILIDVFWVFQIWSLLSDNNLGENSESPVLQTFLLCCPHLRPPGPPIIQMSLPFLSPHSLFSLCFRLDPTEILMFGMLSCVVSGPPNGCPSKAFFPPAPGLSVSGFPCWLSTLPVRLGPWNLSHSHFTIPVWWFQHPHPVWFWDLLGLFKRMFF